MAAPPWAAATATMRSLIDPKPRVLEALDRLQTRFVDNVGAGTRGVRADVSLVDSPVRAVKSNTGFDGIDADLAPLVQRNNGRTIRDGSTVAGEAWGDFRLGKRIVLGMAPRVWVAAPRNSGSELRAELVTGYARVVLRNLAVDVGRNALTRGAAPELSPSLSMNARGLDMIRFSTDRPTRLPWVFRYLGKTHFAGSLSTLGDNRDNPGGILIVWEGSVRPLANLELGVTLMDQQGGEGSPRGAFIERVQEALIVSQRVFWMTRFLWTDPGLGDHFVGFEARLTLPGSGAEAYLELGSTEDSGMFVTHRTSSLWDHAAWLAGLRWRGLGDDGRLDLWTEAAHNGPGPYSHVAITSGLTLDRRNLGSPLGPSAASFQGGATWNGTLVRLSVSGAWEYYSADQYIMSGDTDFGGGVYVLASKHPGETRRRLTGEWVREPTRPGLPTANVRIGFEQVARFNFIEASRAHFLIQAGFAWSW